MNSPIEGCKCDNHSMWLLWGLGSYCTSRCHWQPAEQSLPTQGSRAVIFLALSGATALSVQNIKDAILILSRTGMLTPMWTPVTPTVVSSWLDVLWVVDHSWYTGNCWAWKNLADLQLLMQIGAPGTYYHTPFKRHFNIMSCPFTIWMAHIDNPSLKSKKSLLTGLSPSPSSTLVEEDLTSDKRSYHSFHLVSLCQWQSRCP